MISILSGTTTPLAVVPLAVIGAQPAYGVIGSVVRLNGQGSQDPGALAPKSGTDGFSVSPDILSTATGGFTTQDLNRVVTLVGGKDAGLYRILSITSTTQVTLVNAGDGGSPLFLGDSTSWSITDELSYLWEFLRTPIGSKVAQEGFRTLDPDGSLVSFSPDVVGEYSVALTVANSSFTSPAVSTLVSIRAILVPHGRGLVPDGKWIWSYLRDVWNEVENREWFETFWSALIQIVGGEFLKLYQVDFNKSIRDIQDMFQRRWLSYEPKLDLVEADLSFFLGNQSVGQDASTLNLNLAGMAIISGTNEVVVVTGSPTPSAIGEVLSITYDDKAPANIGDYSVLGLNSAKTGYRLSGSLNPAPDKVDHGVFFSFDVQSTTWRYSEIRSIAYAEAMSISPSPIDDYTPILAKAVGAVEGGSFHPGDYVYIPRGPSAGYYRIVTISGSFITVDRAPPSSSDGTIPCDVYRPVSFKVTLPDSVTSNAFSVAYTPGPGNLSLIAPGRVVVVGGQCFTVLRSSIDYSRSTPLSLVTVDGQGILTGLVGQNWRVPHTLVSASQTFEDLGVSPGDLLLVDVYNANVKTAVQVVAQVIGIDGNRLGFVLTDEVVQPGVIPAIPNETFTNLASTFNIGSVIPMPDGSLSFTGLANQILTAIKSSIFANEYFNTELTTSSEISILGVPFTLRPKTIIRNLTVPIDENLRSIPMLQDWIVQPTWVQHDGGTFQVKKGKEYKIPGPPLTLVENLDFIIDDEDALYEELGFLTGTDIIEVEDGHFLDLGIRPGDEFIIHAPVSLAGTYFISRVLSQNELLLSRPVPEYVLGSNVTALVGIKRNRVGHFLRFVPGGFTAKNPAPNRLWAEVSFFDNNDAVEANFGILVGLKRSDLQDISTTINYRQAVAGLMFAYTKGSALDKIRLGGQILLGLPFAEHTGVVQSVENDYRLDINGTPIQGRLLIEDTDPNGVLQGTTRAYIFPVDSQSDLAGVDVNPATNLPYAVGDSVALFAALSKGVEINDYLTKPLSPFSSPTSLLQQFHTVRLRANDNIFSLSELGRVSDFLKKITPSYVQFILTSTAEFSDNVSIQDVLNMVASGVLYDNPSTGLPGALKWDSFSPIRGAPLSAWSSEYFARVTGQDLQTTYDSATPSVVATSAAGGFVGPQPPNDGPVSRPGDVLAILDGPNFGKYPITAVTDDSTLQVSGTPTSGFQTASQPFAILRPVSPLLTSGVFTAASGSAVQVVGTGLKSNLVAPGDWFLAYNGSDAQLGVLISVGAPNVAEGSVQLQDPVTSLSGSCSYHIYRPSLLTSPSNAAGTTGTLTSNGSSYTALDAFVKVLLGVGDELVLTDGTGRRLFAADPLGLGILPVLPAGTYNVEVAKRGHFAAPTSGTELRWDHLQWWNPADHLSVYLVDEVADATTTASSGTVVITAAILATAPSPGELFLFTSGQNATTDVGYGPGVYPILSGSTATSVILARAVSFSESNTFKILRRQ